MESGSKNENVVGRKVLLISPQPFFQWRGSPIRVGFNCMALVENGYAVDLLTLPIGEKREIDGVNIIRVANPLGVQNIPIGPSLHKIVFDFLLLFKGVILALRNKYDVVHGIEETGMIAVLLAKLAGGKAIFEKHSDPFSYKKGFLKNCLLSMYALVEKLTVRWTDGVIGTGPGLVKQVNDMGTTTPAFHIFDIPSSLVEPVQENVDRVREKLVQKDNELLVTFVGSFAVYQGVDLLLESIPLVIRQNPNARFIIIGGTEEEIRERISRLQNEGVEGSVTFLGKIAPDLLPDYLAASDILLSPRVSGVNTPLKLLDYLKIGKPIVATDVVANRLILDESNSALTLAEPAALAEGIEILLADPLKRGEMGKSGRQAHEKKYNFKEYTKRLADCYERILGT